jgi:hypothetical protein
MEQHDHDAFLAMMEENDTAVATPDMLRVTAFISAFVAYLGCDRASRYRDDVAAFYDAYIDAGDTFLNFMSRFFPR